ncbi:MAG TPA: hypothetical protein VOA87_11785, partial [Thermoanaerobaculia bacterium]|nr:hypothetical protein [Thermoanaerobaculia bacterium]
MTGISGSFQAVLTPTAGGLTVDQFVALPGTPGNVGICLCGGGSRALSAGMGQLRALAFLQANGRSLLSQTRTISTVSGGSWLGVTFEYLGAGTTDAQFLNDYVADPGLLVPTTTAGSSPAEILDVLPDGNIGNAISDDLFSVPTLALEAFILYKVFGTPPSFLWQALMGLHILRPYGLYDPGAQALPTSLFSWDGPTLAAAVTGPNPALAGETAHLVASGAGHDRRPYLICNTAMFLNEPGTQFQYLAPVQATPFLTGIVGSPAGTDADGLPPGGGGVTSFAFSSIPTAVAGAQVTVQQTRQLSLVDIVGASSAAYAETIENLFATWQEDTSQFLAVMKESGEEVLKRLGELLVHGDITKIVELLALAAGAATLSDHAKLKADLACLRDLNPEFQYWPVAGVAPAATVQPTRFADGGSLENTGIAGTLSYTDVDRLIAFLNSSTPLAAGDLGVIGPDGQEIPDTRVIVDSEVPPLFGYQPYQSAAGYVLYAGAATPTQPIYKHNQVFPSDQFAPLLQGLWAASGSGSNASPALFTQTLAVEGNPWFGVRDGRTVTILWVYLSRVQAWYDALPPAVQAILGSFDDPTSFNSFPNYGTFDLDLSATEINLLASLTAWTLAA